MNYDPAEFEKACPPSCLQFQRGKRENCSSCDRHGACPTQRKAYFTKFCTAASDEDDGCRGCKHFPDNWLPTADPELAAEYKAFMSDPASKTVKICPLKVK